MEEATSLRVPKRLGSKAILVMRNLKLSNSQLTVKRERDYVIIPLYRVPTTKETKVLKTLLQETEITLDRFEKRKIRKAKTLRMILEDKLSPQLLAKLPRSMDIIGQVAIIEVPPELEGYEKLLGETVIEIHRNVKTVLAKAGAVSGEHRLRKFKTIAGTGETETTYREHGCTYILDLAKVYFSPRLSQERWRIAQKVRGGEVVIDMFTGVGPFSILIAKKNCDVKVYAIDVNPIAIKFLNRNIDANKVGNVCPILGDAKEVIENTLAGQADRAIMNLPERAIEFVDVACKALKPSGGIIHYYGFESESDGLEKTKESLIKAVFQAGRKVKTVLDYRFVRQTAPYEWQIAVDALIS